MEENLAAIFYHVMTLCAMTHLRITRSLMFHIPCRSAGSIGKSSRFSSVATQPIQTRPWHHCRIIARILCGDEFMSSGHAIHNKPRTQSHPPPASLLNQNTRNVYIDDITSLRQARSGAAASSQTKPNHPGYQNLKVRRICCRCFRFFFSFLFNLCHCSS